MGLSDFGKYSKEGYDSNNIEIMDDELDFEEEPDLLEGDDMNNRRRRIIDSR